MTKPQDEHTTRVLSADALDKLQQQTEAQPYLEVLTGPAKGKKVLLVSTTTTLGRSSRSHVQLEDPLISANHARIVRRGDEYIVEDRQSKNGTLVNGRSVQSTKLNAGDRLQLGGTKLIFVVPATT